MNAITAIDAAPADQSLDWFTHAISSERDALSQFLNASAQPEIASAIELLAAQSQPVVFTGIGKSGHIAAKIAATFSSLGTPALFLNAAEAAHGDLGAVQSGSVIVAISNSGSTEEIVRLLPLFKARGCALLAIIGRAASPLARAADCCIVAEIAREADPIGMAPTSSTTLHLAIGDALAIAVSRLRGFTREDFLCHHPAGLLGRQMIPVSSLMRRGQDVPKVAAETPLLDLLAIMSAKRMGAACVVGEGDHLLGLVVDGDVRRQLQSGEAITAITAGAIMQARPQTIAESATLGDVLGLRKGARPAWLVLPVVGKGGRLKGMLHAHDLDG